MSARFSLVYSVLQSFIIFQVQYQQQQKCVTRMLNCSWLWCIDLASPRSPLWAFIFLYFSWVAVFQFFVCLPLSLPAALVGNPSVSPLELPRNLWNGWMCYLGYNSVMIGEHPDNCWPGGPLYVTLYLIANINFNILTIMVSKWDEDVVVGIVDVGEKKAVLAL